MSGIKPLDGLRNVLGMSETARDPGGASPRGTAPSQSIRAWMIRPGVAARRRLLGPGSPAVGLHRSGPRPHLAQELLWPREERVLDQHAADDGNRMSA
jgi:hypothetical protein